MAKFYSDNARRRIRQSVEWTERKRTQLPPSKKRRVTQQTNLVCAVALTGARNKEIGTAALAEASTFTSVFGAGTKELVVYNAGPEYEVGAELILQKASLKGPSTQDAVKWVVIEAYPTKQEPTDPGDPGGGGGDISITMRYLSANSFIEVGTGVSDGILTPNGRSWVARGLPDNNFDMFTTSSAEPVVAPFLEVSPNIDFEPLNGSFMAFTRIIGKVVKTSQSPTSSSGSMSLRASIHSLGVYTLISEHVTYDDTVEDWDIRVTSNTVIPSELHDSYINLGLSYQPEDDGWGFDVSSIRIAFIGFSDEVPFFNFGHLVD